MNDSKLDHIIVAAANLAEGADYVESILGVEVPDGGEHLMMGTHNKVMTLGNDVYLEIIAIDPRMLGPTHPRWFGLDDPAVAASLKHSPRLLTWAINTTDVEALCAQSEITVGVVQEASRDDLRWKVALTDDGRLSAAGFFPLCIQWLVDFHPSKRMQDLGCRLESIDIYHPYPEWLRSALESIGSQQLVNVLSADDGEMPRIDANISTPNGLAVLSSAR